MAAAGTDDFQEARQEESIAASWILGAYPMK